MSSYINDSNIAILSIHSPCYCCIISGIRKSEAVNLLQKSDLNEKRKILQNIKSYSHI